MEQRLKHNEQAENGLQSRSSENGSVALWIKIAVILNWRYGMVWYGFVGIVWYGWVGVVMTGIDDWHRIHGF